VTHTQDRWQTIEARDLQVGDRLRTGPDEAGLEATEVQSWEAEGMGPHVSVTWVSVTGSITRDLIDANDKLQVLRRATTQAWTLTWPTEPGWYWTWEPGEDGMPNNLEPAQVIERRNKTPGYGLSGVAIYERDYPRLHWGPRIEVPQPPEDAP
jgi:hypothetical protein